MDIDVVVTGFDRVAHAEARQVVAAEAGGKAFAEFHFATGARVRRQPAYKHQRGADGHSQRGVAQGMLRAALTGGGSQAHGVDAAAVQPR